MNTESQTRLHADNTNDELAVEATLSTSEEPHRERKETFADFNVRADIVSALADAGITHPFPIQAMTLPVALAGHDIIGQAKTGTGKTLGFGIPALQRVVSPSDQGFDKLPAPGAPQAMVIVPTRELAVQVANDLSTASRHRGARIATIYGGRAYEPQIESLVKGVEIVVGTPGRLIDLYKQKHLNLKNVKLVVLDEADEMLDLGFLPDVETLIAGTPAVRQTLLFSATMPGAVVAMARRYMTQPTHIRAADPDDEGLTKRDIRQLIYRAHSMDKAEVVARILQARGRGRTIIFTKTKRTAAKVAEELVDRGFAAAAIHGDLGQGAREQALRAFRNNKVDVLVATDVAARGIDVDDVTHVINYQCVEDEKIYLHRVGRTGRAGNKGTAVTFVDWDDMPRWGLINKALGLSVPGTRRNVLLLPAPVRGPGHPRGHQGPAAAQQAHARGHRCRGAGGPGRDGQAPRLVPRRARRRLPRRARRRLPRRPSGSARRRGGVPVPQIRTKQQLAARVDAAAPAAAPSAGEGTETAVAAATDRPTARRATTSSQGRAAAAQPQPDPPPQR